MTRAVRIATPGDGSGMAHIYGPIVCDTATSFELAPPTGAEMAARVGAALPTLPWLVAAEGLQIEAYAYAAPHRSRAAYQWTVEVSLYVHAELRRKGLGRTLYRALLGILAAQGYRTALAGVTLPNEASVCLHESLGFAPVGVYRNVGFKLGHWRDVGWWCLGLGECAHPPAPPRRFNELQASEVARLLSGASLA